MLEFNKISHSVPAETEESKDADETMEENTEENTEETNQDEFDPKFYFLQI